jgi:hypothetical protein
MVISLSAFSTRLYHGARGSPRPVDKFGGHIEKHYTTQAGEAREVHCKPANVEFKRETCKHKFR